MLLSAGKAWILNLLLLAVIFVLGALSIAYGYDEPAWAYDEPFNVAPVEVAVVADEAIGLVPDPAGDAGHVYDLSAYLVATNTADDVLRLSAEESWGNLNTLDDHFIRHGADFGASSADDYAAQASEFFQRAQQQGLPTKIDANGVIRIYDPATNTFGAYNATGTTGTFFTPKRGIDYWFDQPGVAPWGPGS